MESKKFEAMLPIITADLANAIVAEFNLEEDEAMKKLYSSKVYSLLENEQTKLWQYSTEMLLELYKRELKGVLELPEV